MVCSFGHSRAEPDRPGVTQPKSPLPSNPQIPISIAEVPSAGDGSGGGGGGDAVKDDIGDREETK